MMFIRQIRIKKEETLRENYIKYPEKYKPLNEDDNNPLNKLNPSYKAILILHEELNDCEIPNELLRLHDGWKIAYPNQEECIFDVIEHRGSYGHEDDFMEGMGYGISDVEGVRGYLTIEDAFRLFKAADERFGEDAQ